jgi:hypothetical protein
MADDDRKTMDTTFAVHNKRESDSVGRESPGAKRKTTDNGDKKKTGIFNEEEEGTAEGRHNLGRGQGQNKAKGRGKGKGKDRPDTDNSVEGILLTHSKLLARAAQERREEARRNQLVIEMDSKSELAHSMDEKAQEWEANRKKNGATKAGKVDKHEFLWLFFCQSVYNMAKQAPKDQKSKYLANWAELALGDADDKFTDLDPRCTAAMFKAVGRQGRPRPQQGPYIWILKMRRDTKRTRECEEDLLRLPEELQQICGVKVRKDTGPKDGLDRALEDHLQHLKL